jgi:hypothetical protein
MKLVFQATMTVKFSDTIHPILSKFTNKEFPFASAHGISGVFDMSDVETHSSDSLHATFSINTENKKMFDSFEHYLNCIETVLLKNFKLSLNFYDIKNVVIRLQSDLTSDISVSPYQLLKDVDDSYYVSKSGNLITNHDSIEAALTWINER